jgi:hypothetical protein
MIYNCGQFQNDYSNGSRREATLRLLPSET